MVAYFPRGLTMRFYSNLKDNEFQVIQWIISPLTLIVTFLGCQQFDVGPLKGCHSTGGLPYLNHLILLHFFSTEWITL